MIRITREGTHRLIAFPDLPGCQTFTGPREDLTAIATEAVVGWLEAPLEHGDAPSAPRLRQTQPSIRSVESPTALA